MNVKPTLARETEKSCSTTRSSTSAFRSSGSASQAARVDTNSVLPPSGGTSRAVRMEHSDGTRLKVLSACHW